VEESAVHRAARAFSATADNYEQARPGYPSETIAWLRARLALGPGRRVLDLAAGTGKLTRGLVAEGGAVIAVEPVEGMRLALAGVVPEAATVAGTAQALPLGAGTVDAACVAQAFHWFAHADALAELHRVLRPGAHLALVWNRRDLTDPLQTMLEATLNPLRGDTPSFVSGRWRLALESDDGRRRFEAAGESCVTWRQPVDVEGVVRRAASVSFVAALGHAQRERLLEQIRQAAQQVSPPLFLPYTTEAYCYRRVS
jgi:SAM-dependent methyltransferase